MPGATASGADKGGASSGAARSREHRQGNQGRTYTVEQEAAVIRIRRCQPTAFYDILGLESVRSTCSDGEIKKAYRKQSLLTHPDKNGHDKADEAFKMVSRAFGILGDKEKKEKFDRFGGDPDSRFQAAQAQNPFSGFGGARAPQGFGGGGGRQWEEELSPEEMFARFFGGGGGFGGGGFGGPEFVFNFGGGPGIRVHQFGGGRPRRRPREAQQANGQPQQPASPLQNLLGILPILIFFVLPMLTSLFNFGGSSPPTPKMVFDNPSPPQTHLRETTVLGIRYFVDPVAVDGWNDVELDQLDRLAEKQLAQILNLQCEHEIRHHQRLKEAAQGWFYQDPDKIARANDYEMASCNRLRNLKKKSKQKK